MRKAGLLGAEEIVGRRREVRDRVRQFLHVGDAAHLQVLALKARDRNRHLLQILGAAPRRDDHLFERAAVLARSQYPSRGSTTQADVKPINPRSKLNCASRSVVLMPSSMLMPGL
jgi:hypothetical protein